MRDQPFHAIQASKISAEATSAEQDLRIALSYVEDAERPFFDKRIKLTFDDTPELFDKVTKAAQYLAAARKKDPAQILVVQDEKLGPIKYTVDEIAGAISYREGRTSLLAWNSAFNDQNRSENLLRARAAFTKATKFCPDRSWYFIELADVCRFQRDKQAALENITKALLLEPDSTDAIKVKDEINAIPDKEPPPPKESHPFLYSWLFSVACFIAAMIVIGTSDYRHPIIPEGWYFLLSLIGVGGTFGIPILYLKIASDDRKSYEAYESVRSAQETAKIMGEIYEHRYQSERERK